MRLMSLVALLVAGICGYAGYQIYQPLNPGKVVHIEVESGNSGTSIARKLHEGGVIQSSWLFRVFGRVTGSSGNMKKGFYTFEKPANLLEVMNRLVRGDVDQFSVTIPEGLSLYEMLLHLSRNTEVSLLSWKDHLAELLDGQEGEGLFLPDTYQYEKPLPPKTLLARMRRAQSDVFTSEKPAVDFSEDELRVVASIIEKETSVPEERPVVAAVIYNRLKKKMPLQMDPTVIYGLWRVDDFFSGDLRRKDLQRDTPWNTYTRRGLPPTPIANPGKDSILAAMYPADSKALYFVADGTGGHVFADNLKDHQSNVQAWMKIEKNR